MTYTTETPALPGRTAIAEAFIAAEWNPFPDKRFTGLDLLTPLSRAIGRTILEF